MNWTAYRILFPILILLLPLGKVVGQDRPQQKLGPGVEESIASGENPRVVVALEEPFSSQKKDVNTETLNQKVQNLQAQVLSKVSSSGFQVIQRYKSVPAFVGIAASETALNRLAEHSKVRRIDLETGGGGSLDTSVEIIDADQWHDDGVRGGEATVAVLDSGVDTDHEDLTSDLAHEACFLNFNGEGQCPDGTDQQFGDGAAEDDHGHGTSVTGILTSDGVHAPEGVAPDAEIVAIKVLNSENRFSSFSEITAALDYIINNPELGIQVINMSLGTDAQFVSECDNSTSWNMAGASAINTLRSQGTIALASSMNKGSATEMASPACLSGVVSVGATDDGDNVTDFTNSNQYLDLVAPGQGIQTSGRGNEVSFFGGTSAAAPHAAGCAALLLDSEINPTVADLESSLTASPTHVTDPKNGLAFPRLNCFAVASDTRTVDESERVAFENAGISLDFFSEVNSAGAVTVNRYAGEPDGTSGIDKENVGDAHLTIDGESSLEFDTTTVRLAVGTLSGVDDPTNVTIYRRDEVGTGTFEMLETTVDNNGTPDNIGDDTLSAKTTGLSEFALGSDTEPLPVELADVEATVDGETVRLTWQTASETNNAGFEVERRLVETEGREDGTWTRIGRVEGAGTTTGTTSYRFADTGLPYDADKLRYRLKQVDTDGSAHYSDPVTVERSIDQVQLLGTYPNPAQSRMTVRYALPEAREVTIRLYNILGQQVRTVVDEEQDGRHKRPVDVRDLSSGVYFLRFQAGGQTRTQKLTVVR